jgi:hypothetical protein
LSQRTFLSFVLAMSVLLSGDLAFSNCTTPNGVAGMMSWVPANGAVSYCDGTAWVTLSSQTSVASCTDTGKIEFSGGDIRYCGGSYWASMDSSFVIGTCTGPAGRMQYDSAINRMKWCNGTNWKLMGGSTNAAVNVTYNSSPTNLTDQTVFTFSNQPLNAPSASRHILVAVSARGTTARTVSSLTVAGVAAAEIKTGFNNSSHTSFWAAYVPNGSSGDIVVTFSGSLTRAAISSWSVSNLKSLTAVSTLTLTTTTTSGSIATTGGGAAFGILYSNYSTAVAWTGLTEDSDISTTDVGLNVHFSSASETSLADAAARPISFSLTGSAADTSVTVISVR